MNLKIEDMPLTDRPRERLIVHGSEVLSDAELLQIILKTGYQNYSVKVLAHELLKEIKDIHHLKEMTYEDLIQIKGIGKAKATELLALVELSKRLNREYDSLLGLSFTNGEMFWKYYHRKLYGKKQECFYVVYLDSQKKIIRDKLLFLGTVDKSIVHPREIFKESYQYSASYIVCIHNHPSGNVLPSKEDIIFTKRLKEIGITMGIPLLDHIIIGKDTYYSFYENKDI